MYPKNRDRSYRYRSLTVGFRMSPEERDALNERIKMSGLTKQDYMIACTLNSEIIVHGNPYVHKCLQEELQKFINLFKKLKSIEELSLEDLETMQIMLTTIEALKENKKTKIKLMMEPRQ